MPTVKKGIRKRISLYPEKGLYEVLEAHAKASCISMNESCLNLLARGLLAEDIETIKSDLGGFADKISNLGGLSRGEQLVLLEILGYMRIFFAESNPDNVDRAKSFAQSYINDLSKEDRDE